jgi:hypothetical protein
LWNVVEDSAKKYQAESKRGILIGNMILENAAKDRPDVVFDLDRRTAHGVDFGLLHTNWRTRYHLLLNCNTCNNVTVLMETDELTTIFKIWTKFRERKPEPISKTFPRRRHSWQRVSSQLPALISSIKLKFEIFATKTLADLRINVLDFVRLTYDLEALTIIHFRLGCTTDESRYEEKYSTDLYVLRQNCFVLLSQVLEQHQLGVICACHDIWINGGGEVVEARYPQHHGCPRRIIKNLHVGLDRPALSKLGYHYASSLEVRPSTEDDDLYISLSDRGSLENALNEGDSLRAMWESLCDAGWPDKKPSDINFNVRSKFGGASLVQWRS